MTNAEILERHGIELKKETKTYSILSIDGEDIRVSKRYYELILKACEYHKYPFPIGELPATNIGVELEFVGDYDYKCGFFREVADKCNKYHINDMDGRYIHNPGESWFLGYDSSIAYNRPSCYDSMKYPQPYELTTPKLEYGNEEDMNQLRIMMGLVKDAFRGVVNDSCGTHVHISFEAKRPIHGDRVRCMLHTYSVIESKVFDPIVPSSRRRNRFCRPTKAVIRDKYRKLSARYCVYDHNLRGYKKLRFEARQLEGTLDYDTLRYWIELQVAIIHLVYRRVMDDSVETLFNYNIFDFLFGFSFPNDLRKFFIKRVLDNKSRAMFR